MKTKSEYGKIISVLVLILPCGMYTVYVYIYIYIGKLYIKIIIILNFTVHSFKLNSMLQI